MSNQQQLNEADFSAVRDGLGEIHRALIDNLKDAKRFTTPALINVPAGSSLFDIVVDRGDRHLERLEGNRISGEWIGKLIARLDGVLNRVKRLHYKSLGSMLALQEKLSVEWSASATAAASEIQANP